MAVRKERASWNELKEWSMTGHAISNLLKDRAANSSVPNAREDKAHIALIIEAGGMRAASVGGMIEALREAGWLSLFDSYHGSSAGACAAAYIAGQCSELGEDIYNRHLLDPDMINLWRLFSSPAIVDTDYIVDEVFKQKAPLDWQKVLGSDTKLYIDLTCKSSGERLTISEFENEKTLFQSLKATLRIPGPGERGVEVQGVLCVDGGVANPFSIESARECGATHFLVLCAQRDSDYNFSSSLERFIETFYMFLSGGFKLSKAHWRGYRKHLKLFENDEFFKFVARPNNATKCGIFNQDAKTIRRVWNEGKMAMQYYIDTVYGPIQRDC